MKHFTTISLLFAFIEPTFSQNKKEDNKSPQIAFEKRLKDLISRLTLEEKIAQLSLKSLGALKMDKNGNIPECSLESVFNNQSTGCLESPLYYIGYEKITNLALAADKYMGTKTRLPEMC